MTRQALVGRDAERARLGVWLQLVATPAENAAGGAPDQPLAVVCSITGAEGIGKTTLLLDTCAAATADGWQLRLTRPVESRVGGASTRSVGAADLLADLPQEVLGRLPVGWRAAIEVLSLRTPPGPGGVDDAVSDAAFVAALRAVAQMRPLLVAVDDAQWLDPGCARLLDALLRRLSPADPIRVLIAARPGRSALDLRQASPGHLALHLGALSDAELAALLLERLGVDVPRRTAARLLQICSGNTYYALELAVEVARRGLTLDAALRPDAALPLPMSLQDLLGSRLRAQPEQITTAVLLVALGGQVRRSVLIRAGATPDAVTAATDAGLLALAADRLHVAHPLLGAAVCAEAGPAAKRAAHAALAAALPGAEDRAWHFGLAAAGTDEVAAAQLAAAAATAAARGASGAAAQLAELGWRRTAPVAVSPSSAEPEDLRGDRLRTAISLWLRAGDLPRVIELAEEGLAEDPAPDLAAELQFMRWRALGTSPVLSAAPTAGDNGVRSQVLGEDAFRLLTSHLDCRSDTLLRAAVAAAASSTNLAGRVLVDETVAWRAAMRAEAPTARSADRWRDSGLPVNDHPLRLTAVRAIWRGQVATARQALAELTALATAQQESWSLSIVLLHVVELEARRGDQVVLARAVQAFREARAHLPHPEEALARAAGYLAVAEGAPSRVLIPPLAVSQLSWHALELLRSRGAAALLAGDAAAAVADLAAVHTRIVGGGVAEPGVLPVGADYVEALVAVGAIDAATALSQELAAAAAAGSHPWAAAAAGRAEAALALAAGDHHRALTVAQRTAGAARDADLPADAVRAELTAGMALRRLRRRKDARAALLACAEQAAALGQAALLVTTTAELNRLGGRSASGQLTGAEQQVADLVARGLSNAEVAAALSISVATVEAHLTRAFAKFGVRSRTALARQLTG